jgi:hypothetical protein
MKALYNKININLIISFLLLSLFFISCKTDDSFAIVNGHFSGQIDTSIFLYSMPSNVYLELGKSVLIQNSWTIFRFIDVLEDSDTNSQILIQIEYGYVIKTIELNTKTIPQSYSLENGYYHVIYLKELKSLGSSYQIMFTYNEYAWL